MKKAVLFVLFLSFLVACKENEPPAPTISAFSPTADGVGAAVQVNGSNFGIDISNVSLEFNGVEASIAAISDTLITVHVPEGATNGPITAKVGGLTTTSTQDFEVLRGRWEQKANLIAGRFYAITFSIGGIGYIGTGVEPPVPLNDFYAYDPSQDKWTRKADLPGRRYQAVAFVIGNKAYVGLGRGEEPGNLNDFYEYDPSSDQWTAVANFPGAARYGAVAFATGGKGYVGLGASSGATPALKDMWSYDPAVDEWKQLSNFPGSGRDKGIGIAVDGKGFVGLGFMSLHDFWRYDPTADSWTAATSYPEDGTRTYDVTTFAMGGRIYILGGHLSRCMEYDPATDKWQARTSIPETFGAGNSFSIGSQGFATTGKLPAPFTSRLWEFELR